MNLYLQCALISLIGIALNALLVIKSLTTKAKVSNVIFNWGLFFKTDLLIQIVGAALTVGLFLMLLDPFLKQYPKYANSVFFILIAFAFIGYFGADVASRLFSAVNNRLNKAIDEKTNLADYHTGNLDAPTEAPKPDKL